MSGYRIGPYSAGYRPAGAYRVGAYGDGSVSSAVAAAQFVAPGAPALWYSAQNIDAVNNTTLTDGQVIATWKNLGSVGSAGDLTQATAGSRPQFNRVAQTGKLNNYSAVSSLIGTRWMQSGATGAIAQPTLIVLVARTNSNSATFGDLFDGNAARQVVYRNTLSCEIYAGGSIVATGKSWVLSTWHTVSLTFNGASSSGRVDGSAGGAVNPGASALNGVTIFRDSGGAAFPWDGDIVQALVYADGTAAATVESAITSFYGATPQ